jgi:hypothetical protein
MTVGPMAHYEQMAIVHGHAKKWALPLFGANGSGETG